MIRKLPSTTGALQLKSKLDEFAPWFYKFNFENGYITESQSEIIDEIHNTRAQMLFSYIDPLFEGKWGSIRCLDIACHQGWFTSQFAVRGAKEVLGADVSIDHISKAKIIKELSGLSNMNFINESVYNLDPSKIGSFELTLCFGLLYHIDNPVGALSALRACTKNVALIETQVAREAPDLQCRNGADYSFKSGAGIAVVPADPNHAEKNKRVVLVPTLKALYDMLYGVGFDMVHLVVPPKDLFFQYPEGDRVILAAQVNS